MRLSTGAVVGVGRALVLSLLPGRQPVAAFHCCPYCQPCQRVRTLSYLLLAFLFFSFCFFARGKIGGSVIHLPFPPPLSRGGGLARGSIVVVVDAACWKPGVRRWRWPDCTPAGCFAAPSAASSLAVRRRLADKALLFFPAVTPLQGSGGVQRDLPSV